ncbi:chromate efflux transporter [Shewanella acanthi]|uniref:chromate efflux transporter n=1 Tax=Shewanella acanthi TaxID=2864212 RepID=UPI001C66249E|nr:chromate efflux transporter [Shewanella acanthi]QYJ80663.1 chromate efflux transporter [Shewanella acanthi]
MQLIFLRFLILGLTGFGGPAAHIGYFRQTFVNELNWLDDKRFASFIALSQLMPGPSSSQLGFAIGYHRGGIFGALCAFAGFTLPSFVLMYLLAISTAAWLGNSYLQGVVHGLKLLAVVVVADALLSMFQQFCQRRLTRFLMLASACCLLIFPSLWMQMGLILLAASIGAWRSGGAKDSSVEPSQISLNYRYLGLFLLLFTASFFIGRLSSGAEVFGEFYRAGSLVFGGGHVVLPLLESLIGDSVSSDRFLTGYAFAQSVPGPMFSFASFLGAEILIDSPFIGACIATLGIFLPGFLLMLVGLNCWHVLAARPTFAGAIAGVNAAVVGFLAAVLYQPVFIQAVLSPLDMALVLVGFGLLRLVRPTILLLVFAFAVLGFLRSFIG